MFSFRLLQLFDVVDIDKNGTIDREEMQRLVELMLGYGAPSLSHKLRKQSRGKAAWCVTELQTTQVADCWVWAADRRILVKFIASLSTSPSANWNHGDHPRSLGIRLVR